MTFGPPNPSGLALLVGLTEDGIQHYMATMAAPRCSPQVARRPRPNVLRVSVAFTGPLRHNSIEMLDWIGVPECLGSASTAPLWGDAANLIAATWALGGTPSFVSCAAIPTTDAGLTRDAELLARALSGVDSR